MPRAPEEPVIAAIDVGTNAVRLEIARVRRDGTLDVLHQERDAVRPGEGLFLSGAMPKPTIERLLAAMRRYGALCRRYKARIRAVATSAVREARNRDDIIRRVQAEAGFRLEVISGQEEARLICLGVLQGSVAARKSLVVDIGGGSTEIALAAGERPLHLWSVEVGAVRLTELFASAGRVGPPKLRLIRTLVREAFADSIPRSAAGRITSAQGSSGTIEAVVSFAADRGASRATARQVAEAVETLAEMTPAERRRHFDSRRAEIIVAGAVIVETVLRHLRLRSISAVDRGLRDGVLLDLLRRNAGEPEGPLAESALGFAQRFRTAHEHAGHVSELALSLFDQMGTVHRLPRSARRLLEASALLHDVGHAVSPQRHHKHSQYIIRNGDIAGVTDKERELVALITRFHRRSPPDPHHVELEPLPTGERQMVRKLSTLLRVADSLDRGHHQNVRAVAVRVSRRSVRLTLRRRAPVDLEIWDTEHEAVLFRRVFGRRLELLSRR
jgi:exopolyphosphatase/guanosine-5'-triphosphate,3'-diphosphate pyrophosphatase